MSKEKEGRKGDESNYWREEKGREEKLIITAKEVKSLGGNWLIGPGGRLLKRGASGSFEEVVRNGISVFVELL